MKTLQTLALTAAIVSLVSACETAPSIDSATQQGAECRQQCTTKRDSCADSVDACDRAYTTCVDTCAAGQRERELPSIY